jgi:hypothetical protein
VRVGCARKISAERNPGSCGTPDLQVEHVPNSPPTLMTTLLTCLPFGPTGGGAYPHALGNCSIQPTGKIIV